MQIIGDFQTSVHKALKEIDPNYDKYDALVVCGTHRKGWDIPMILETIKEARENGTPTLLICWGHQLGAIEYARNVLGIKDATSEEFGKGTIIVHKLPQLKVGLHDGETYWNNYEVDKDILKLWKKDDNFVTCQFHPEYQSSKERPHPLLFNFIDYARNQM